MILGKHNWTTPCISPTVTADTNSWSAGTAAIQSRTAPWGRGRRSSETTLVSKRYMCLLDSQGDTAAMLSARWRKLLGSRLGGEEQLLQVRPGHPLQPPPLLDGKEHSGLDSALGHDLRPLGDGSV